MMDDPRRLRLKSLLKHSLIAIARSKPFPQPHARILTYHSVGKRRHAMTVSPENFERQLAWLKEHTALLSLEEAAQGKSGVAITFDDGFQDNLHNALPVLKHYAAPATIFMVSGDLGGFLPTDAPLRENRLLNAEELRLLDSEGIEIGTHTKSHVRLATLSPEEQREEIATSKADLEKVLGRPLSSFAYPFGSALDYNAKSIALVKEAGFEIAVSNQYGLVPPESNPFTLRRIWVDAHDSLPFFQAKVTGRLDGLSFLDSPLGIRARRTLNRLLR